MQAVLAIYNDPVGACWMHSTAIWNMISRSKRNARVQAEDALDNNNGQRTCSAQTGQHMLTRTFLPHVLVRSRYLLGWLVAICGAYDGH